MHDSSHEVFTRVETQAGKVKRKTELAEHQTCRACGIGNHVGLRTEGTNDDSHDDRTTGDTKADRTCHARYADRDDADGETKEDSEEDTANVRFFKSLDTVAKEMLGIVKVFVFADDGYTVAILQTDVITCKIFFFRNLSFIK